MANGWERCRLPGCDGAALGSERYCLRDLSPVPLDAELERIRAEGTVDARGVTVTPGLLARILEVMPHQDGRTALGDAQFGGAVFEAGCIFDGVDFTGHFDGATFERTTHLGPLLARSIALDGAEFRQWAQLDLAAPSILDGFPVPFTGLDESEAARTWERLPPGPRGERWRPRLLSLRRADVAGLRVSQVDLRPCSFEGAHNLDRLRFEGSPLFPRTSGWWRARRRTLAEEHRWRAARPGREDAKDEPGATDFYYGEMEMRRLDRDAPLAERCILWLYWLISGYALRAWRAIATLVLAVFLAAVGFAFWGFPDAEPAFRPVGVDAAGALVYQPVPADPATGIERLPEAVRFSARSATSLLRGPDRALTPAGESLEIALRLLGPVLLGPVLLGLAVLSIRGRVRR